MMILKRDDLLGLLEMGEVMESVERALLSLYRGRAKSPSRTIIKNENGTILYMPCLLKNPTIKVVSFFPKNRRRKLPTISATVQLNDPETGIALAMMEGSHLTAMRTGATSGVATRYLAGEDSDSVGIIGAGVQARTQLWAVCEARQIEKAEVYDIDIGKARDFAIEMAEKLGIEVSVEESPQRVAKNSDILIIATTSRVPVIEGRWLEGKVHINSVGWVGPDGRELDSSTVEMARLFVDSKEAVLEESGDIIIPIKEGVVTEGKIDGEIGELVSGIKEGRRAEDGITLFKSVGLAIEDAAVAELAYEKALKEGIGLEVEL